MEKSGKEVLMITFTLLISILSFPITWEGKDSTSLSSSSSLSINVLRLCSQWNDPKRSLSSSSSPFDLEDWKSLLFLLFLHVSVSLHVVNFFPCSIHQGMNILERTLLGRLLLGEFVRNFCLFFCSGERGEKIKATMIRSWWWWR